jgi:transposase-like protein
MERRKFTREFKLEAMRLIKEQTLPLLLTPALQSAN